MKLVGERRALAAVTFAFYALVYFLIGSSGVQPQLAPALYALAGVYGVAMFALIAGYFWARWYAVGVGLYGIITAAVGMWQIGPEPVLLFMAATHGAATLMLWGEAMSQSYDGQTAWREKFHMDEHAVQRLGRSVIRAGVSLPFVLLYALMPKQGAAELVLSLAALALTGAGLRGLIRLRTWGVLALGAAGVLLVSLGAGELAVADSGPSGPLAALRPLLGGGLLLLAAAPFARALARATRSH
ncbi:MAG TPA: hypothetical protein VMJ10_10750 [Kofleriaceae bacterium]|nr:hypothetical protein [Kofleriaceae bacterium]